MPRIGQNPNKEAEAYQYKPIVLTAITYLPNQDGYFSHCFEIIKTCLLSMRDNANIDCTVMIWDNGSCRELIDWIQFEYYPGVFIQSINMGKTTARTSLYNMCPPNSIVAYTDDDMLFYPNWLQPQIDLLQAFPNVACVSGYPVRTQQRWGNENTLRWASHHAKLEIGRFIPDEWEYDFALSIGRDPEYQRKYTALDKDYLIEYQGIKAYGMAHHCQMIGYASAIGSVQQYDGKAMQAEREFDIELDKLGLRLCTTERLCRHMGNIMDDKLRNEINAMELPYA